VPGIPRLLGQHQSFPELGGIFAERRPPVIPVRGPGASARAVLFSAFVLTSACVAPIGFVRRARWCAQVVIPLIWGGGQSLFLWEWSAWVIPIFAFMAAYVVAVVAICLADETPRLVETARFQFGLLGAIEHCPGVDFERLVAGALRGAGLVSGTRGPGWP